MELEFPTDADVAQVEFYGRRHALKTKDKREMVSNRA